jgi:hypothetical protein
MQDMAKLSRRRLSQEQVVRPAETHKSQDPTAAQEAQLTGFESPPRTDIQVCAQTHPTARIPKAGPKHRPRSCRHLEESRDERLVRKVREGGD